MATFSSHLLSSVDGQHAAHVTVQIVQRTPGSRDIELALGKTDGGGRFTADITPDAPTEHTRYEYIVHTAAYFQQLNPDLPDVLGEIVVRFAMPDPDARYHIPLMIAPNSYSVWCSPPGG